MRKLIAFENTSLDGYFVDKKNDMSWAHKQDPEWNAFAAENARGGGLLLFGRITYDLMVSYWPTPMAAKNDPVLAERMNNLSKVVFSRTLEKVSWNNARLVKEAMTAKYVAFNCDGAEFAIHASIGIIAICPSGDSNAVFASAMKRASTTPRVCAAVHS